VHRFSGRDGVELVYREIGDGRPLVLLHGFIGDGTQWLDPGPAAAFAGRGYRVILPDLRGHGAGARPRDPAAYPPDVFADDGLALIESLGLDDYDLGGYSLGGRIVLRMLARGARPARAIVAGQGLDAVSQATGRTDGFRQVLTAVINGEPTDDPLAHWVAESGNDPEALMLVLDTHVRTTEAELREIPTPTLVVVGEHDTTHASADALAAAMPNARHATVPGDHYSAMGQLEDVLTEFLSAGGTTPPAAPTPRPRE
jgi:pimeloyl-ACP methyl ester carboxylesterase